MAAISMLFPSVFVEATYSGTYDYFGYAVSAISILLPYFALMGGVGRMSRFYKSHIVVGAAVATLLTISVLPYGWLVAALGYLSGAAIVFATAWVCVKNRLWKGFWGQQVATFGFIACALVLLWRGWVVLAARNGIGFEVDPANTVLGLEMLICASFLMQMGFLNLLVGRELRLDLFAGRRNSRLFESGQALFTEETRLSQLADERLVTLRLLTHEVRQPINNARAALEALHFALPADTPQAAKSKLAIARAQGVIDSVTLAMSNAIFAASFLEENTEIARQTINANEVAALAKTDCPVDLLSRIEGNFDGEPIYVDMDAILIRISLRNLLDNALKYSLANSPIQFSIHQREDSFGTAFKVTSQPKRLDLLNEGVFMRHARGTGAQGGGSGLGLYLVKKVAEAHGGSVSYLVHDNATVTFDLFLPD